MAVFKQHNDEHRKNITDRIGAIFGLQEASQLSGESWRMESYGNRRALLTVELEAVISEDEANAILNGVPLPDAQRPTLDVSREALLHAIEEAVNVAPRDEEHRAIADALLARFDIRNRA